MTQATETRSIDIDGVRQAEESMSGEGVNDIDSQGYPDEQQTADDQHTPEDTSTANGGEPQDGSYIDDEPAESDASDPEDFSTRINAMENMIGQVTQAIHQIGTVLQQQQQMSQTAASRPASQSATVPITLPDDYGDWSSEQQAKWMMGTSMSNIQHVQNLAGNRLQLFGELLDTLMGHVLPDVFQTAGNDPRKVARNLKEAHGQLLDAVQYSMRNNRSFTEAWKLRSAEKLTQQNAMLKKKTENQMAQNDRRKEKAVSQTRKPTLARVHARPVTPNSLGDAIRMVDRELERQGR